MISERVVHYVCPACGTVLAALRDDQFQPPEYYIWHFDETDIAVAWRLNCDPGDGLGGMLFDNGNRMDREFPEHRPTD